VLVGGREKVEVEGGDGVVGVGLQRVEEGMDVVGEGEETASVVGRRIEKPRAWGRIPTHFIQGIHVSNKSETLA
jgi:hypothetical protein